MGNASHIQHLDSTVSGDVALWRKFTQGDTAAYESIYHQYVKELYSYVYTVVRNKSIAEDVIHDLFADLWSNRKSLGEIRSVRLYLFSCVKRRSLKKLKKERTFTCFDYEQESAAFEIVPSFLDELTASQHKDAMAKSIKKCIANLSNRQREIIYLRFYQNMSYSEVAELLQLDQKYIYNLASKAFGLLRKSIPYLVSVISLSLSRF